MLWLDAGGPPSDSRLSYKDGGTEGPTAMLLEKLGYP